MPASAVVDSVDAVVVGGGTVGGWTACLLAEAGRSVALIEADTLGSGRQQPGRRHGARAGRHRARDPARAVQPRLLPRPARPLPARLGLRRAGLPDAVLHRRTRSTPRTSGSRCSARSGSTSSGSTPTSSTGVTPDWPRAWRWARPTPPATATSTHRATCSPTAPRSSRSASRSASTARSPACSVTDGRVSGVATSDRRHRYRRGRAHRRPRPGRGGTGRGRTDPRGRHPASGRRHGAAARPRPARGLPMVFDVASGIYWRPGEDGGLLWGMSNPDEQPGPAREFDWDYYEKMRRPDRDAPAGHRRAGPAPRVGGDDRLHARPPADPRAAAPRRTARSRAPWSPAPAVTA